MNHARKVNEYLEKIRLPGDVIEEAMQEKKLLTLPSSSAFPVVTMVCFYLVYPRGPLVVKNQPWSVLVVVQ